VTALGAASLRVSRLDAFFAIATVSLLGDQLAALRPRRTANGASRALWPAAIACAVLAAVGPLRATTACVRMDRLAWLPEPDVVQALGPKQLRGRLLSWFGWGEYAIWYFGPDLKVSFDGRRETVYSDAFAASHVALYWAPERERELVTTLNADYAWLPRDLPLALMLQREGWTPVFSGPRSVFLSRDPATAAGVTAPVSGRRCFPGP
jgi:hypothetical protein